jgi:outer membrane lipoprotein-sorting protein
MNWVGRALREEKSFPRARWQHYAEDSSSYLVRNDSLFFLNSLKQQMKNILLYIILATWSVNTAFAQKDAQAKTILSQVSQKYKSYDAVKADFTFTVTATQAGVKETQNGTLITLAKTNKFKVTLDEPGTNGQVAQEIISDGKTQWTYLKKDKEVQVNDAGQGSQGFNPANIFTIFEHGYKYIYTGDETAGGRRCQVIDLSPEDANNNFFKIRLMIDKVKKQIYSALIFDKNGSRYNYTIRSLTPNVPAPDNLFTFDKKDHPGVELVDLR